MLPDCGQDKCTQCRGAQWLRCTLPPWHPQYRPCIECECLLRKRREKRCFQLFALSGLPTNRPLPTLQQFRPHVRGVQQAFRVVKNFLERVDEVQEAKDEERQLDRLSHMGWIVLQGSVGVGKTHLAMAASAAALERDMPTLFTSVPDLLDHLRATFAPVSPLLYDELFERMKCAELLVLDDLGTQRSSSWADEKLFQLFNYRYNYQLPTMITLNEKSWAYIDERIRSRLSDQSFVQMVAMHDAQDYRRRQSHSYG